MSATDPSGSLTVTDYLRPVWRFKFVVIAVVVLAAAATYVYSSHRTKSYQTSTQLYVGQSNLQQLLSPSATPQSDRTVADQALLATTPAVAEAVARNLKLSIAPEVLLRDVHVTADASTDFLTITTTSGDATSAARLANGFAQAYLEVAGGNLVSSARASLRSVQQRLRQVAPGSAAAAVRTGLRDQIATLEGIVSSPPPAGQQLTPAGVPGAPVSPRPTRDAAFAALLALALGIVVSYLFDRSDRRVRDLDEIESLFKLPVLANIPHVRQANPTRDDPYGTPPMLREPMRSLRVNLDMARAAPDAKVTSAKVLLVTSALPAEGKSTIVRNLAISYRESGARVAVVEADLRRPVLSAQLGLNSGPGLSEALAARRGDVALQRVNASGEQLNGSSGAIDVAVAGAAPEDPTLLLTEDRLRAPVLQLRAKYDIVIVDSPPLLSVSDGLPLLGLADGVLLVVRAGTITRQAAGRLVGTIDRVNRIQRVDVLGIVANDIADELAEYYGGAYGRRERGRSDKRPSDLATP